MITPATNRRSMPAAACDCHVHVIGSREQYPMMADRHYTPGLAPLAALRAHMKALGIERTVIVQPSVYGTDNRCMLNSLDRLQGVGRGVAVLPDDVSSRELREMHARGVRGVRINLESSGLRDIDAAGALLNRWAARVADLGWHLQLYADSSVVSVLAEELARLPTRTVLDHFGLVAMDPRSATTDMLADLLRTGRVSVKLSAPYRLSSPELAGQWAQIFLQISSEAVLWGSDWPHTARQAERGALEVSAYRKITTEELSTSLNAWLPTSALRQRVLVDNPASLYGF